MSGFLLRKCRALLSPLSSAPMRTLFVRAGTGSPAQALETLQTKMSTEGLERLLQERRVSAPPRGAQRTIVFLRNSRMLPMPILSLILCPSLCSFRGFSSPRLQGNETRRRQSTTAQSASVSHLSSSSCLIPPFNPSNNHLQSTSIGSLFQSEEIPLFESYRQSRTRVWCCWHKFYARATLTKAAAAARRA